ncbi:uncharacterized protein LOC111142028 [Enhydra lutris kenyoni]|uniref:Uncharacterized protein LOC111142028 n=1 Tax=Enhydra lutris kenyoni TaxID=391180 RepID=A0A2Y9IQV8_ENHLU|nr:uncharacterized protein LOC111142028 [Enhydra lutris kenyoni]
MTVKYNSRGGESELCGHQQDCGSLHQRTEAREDSAGQGNAEPVAPGSEQLRPRRYRVPRLRLLAAGSAGLARSPRCGRGRTDRDPASGRPPPSRSARPPARPTLPPPKNARAAPSRGRPHPASGKGGPDAREGKAEPAGQERTAGQRESKRAAERPCCRRGRASRAPHPPVRTVRAAGRRPLTFGAADLPTPSGGNESCHGVSPRAPLACPACEAPPRSREGGCAPACRWRHLKPIPVNELSGAPGKGGDRRGQGGGRRAGPCARPPARPPAHPAAARVRSAAPSLGFGRAGRGRVTFRSGVRRLAGRFRRRRWEEPGLPEEAAPRPPPSASARSPAPTPGPSLRPNSNVTNEHGGFPEDSLAKARLQ